MVFKKKGERHPSFFSCATILENYMKIVTNFPTFLSKNIELGVVRCIAYYFREIISSKEIFEQAF